MVRPKARVARTYASLFGLKKGCCGTPLFFSLLQCGVMPKIAEPSDDGEISKRLLPTELTDQQFEALMAEAKEVDALFQAPLVLRKPNVESKQLSASRDPLHSCIKAWLRGQLRA
jgi:hypothetical protein